MAYRPILTTKAQKAKKCFVLMIKYESWVCVCSAPPPPLFLQQLFFHHIRERDDSIGCKVNTLHTLKSHLVDQKVCAASPGEERAKNQIPSSRTLSNWPTTLFVSDHRNILMLTFFSSQNSCRICYTF